MTSEASGMFDVNLTPQAPQENIGDAGFGWMAIDKQFHGDLEAVSKGQMLAAGTDVPDSAGYVALERVAGSLQGRSGSFVLQHIGNMVRGVPALTITVVPDSGTGELVGLSGSMTITNLNGYHFYQFTYTLNEESSEEHAA